MEQQNSTVSVLHLDEMFLFFSGPKLYVKPSQKSNRHIIVNAISHVCLAGTVNTDIKNKVLEVRQGYFP